MGNKNYLFLDGHPRVLLTEWVPLGVEFIPQLLRKLRCPAATSAKGGISTGTEYYLTSTIDEEPNRALIEGVDSEVMLKVAGTPQRDRVMLEAVISIRETGSAEQDESVGIDITRDGVIHYGMELSRKRSLDDVTRVVADLVEDSSRIMDTLLSSYQRQLLEIVFCQESRHRDKHCLVIVDRLIDSEGFPCALDKLLVQREYRAELSQLLGDLTPDGSASFESGTGFYVSGEHGTLLVCPDGSEAPQLLKRVSSIMATMSFLDNVSARVSSCWDQVRRQQERIKTHGIADIMGIQTELSGLSADQGLLLSVPAHLKRDTEAIDQMMRGDEVEARAGKLGIGLVRESVDAFASNAERIDDTRQSIETLGHGIENVRVLANSLSQQETYKINRLMNILTIVSVIVLPLTLITGIYGMNFARVTPDGQFVSFHNMPELYWQYGYYVVLGVMAFIALSLSFVFWRKGLLGAR